MYIGSWLPFFCESLTSNLYNDKALRWYVIWVYKDQFLKWNAISKTCNDVSSRGQPILIGTTTIEKSEMLAELLKEYKLTYHNKNLFQ